MVIPAGKEPPRIPKRRWDNNIKIDLKQIGRGDTNWINVAENKKKRPVLENMSMRLLSS